MWPSIYADFVGTLVIDEADAALADAVEATGMRCVVAPTVMHTPEHAATLASRLLDAGRPSGAARGSRSAQAGPPTVHGPEVTATEAPDERPVRSPLRTRCDSRAGSLTVLPVTDLGESAAG